MNITPSLLSGNSLDPFAKTQSPRSVPAATRLASFVSSTAKKIFSSRQHRTPTEESIQKRTQETDHKPEETTNPLTQAKKLEIKALEKYQTLQKQLILFERRESDLQTTIDTTEILLDNLSFQIDKIREIEASAKTDPKSKNEISKILSALGECKDLAVTQLKQIQDNSSNVSETEATPIPASDTASNLSFTPTPLQPQDPKEPYAIIQNRFEELGKIGNAFLSTKEATLEQSEKRSRLSRLSKTFAEIYDQIIALINDYKKSCTAEQKKQTDTIIENIREFIEISGIKIYLIDNFQPEFTENRNKDKKVSFS